MAPAPEFHDALRRRTVLTGRMAAVFCLVTMPAFAAMDRRMAPDVADRLLQARLGSSAVLALGLVLLLLPGLRRGLEVAVVFAGAAAIQVQAAVMLPLVGDRLADYLLAMLLVLFGTAAMIDWHWRWTAGLAGVSAAAVTAVQLVGGNTVDAAGNVQIASNLGTVAVLSVSSHWLRYRRALAEFTAQQAAEAATAEAERQRAENVGLLQELARQSREDALTGIPNRRAFDEWIDRELARAARNGSPVGLMVLDVDHFKTVNDTYGHPVGDAVLTTVAAGMRASVRRSDFIARYGGEEFVVVFADVPPHLIGDLAEEVRRRTGEHTAAAAAAGLGVHVTLSAGVALYPSHGSTSEELVRAADVALYRAKSSGRDRLLMSSG